MVRGQFQMNQVAALEAEIRQTFEFLDKNGHFSKHIIWKTKRKKSWIPLFCSVIYLLQQSVCVHAIITLWPKSSELYASQNHVPSKMILAKNHVYMSIEVYEKEFGVSRDKLYEELKK